MQGSGRIALAPGMALTLNGIAQGYIADRVAALLEAEGLGDILIDTGEFRALGGDPRGGDWPVKLGQGGQVNLRSRALATSSPLHHLRCRGPSGPYPRSPDRQAAVPVWRAVSISAPSAALADALSTAACLMEVKAEVETLCEIFTETRPESLTPA